MIHVVYIKKKCFIPKIKILNYEQKKIIIKVFI
nr:MAG TPA: hypothetical protein [Caudoviricetes sp.]